MRPWVIRSSAWEADLGAACLSDGVRDLIEVAS